MSLMAAATVATARRRRRRNGIGWMRRPRNHSRGSTPLLAAPARWCLACMLPADAASCGRCSLRAAAPCAQLMLVCSDQVKPGDVSISHVVRAEDELLVAQAKGKQTVLSDKQKIAIYRKLRFEARCFLVFCILFVWSIYSRRTVKDAFRLQACALLHVSFSARSLLHTPKIISGHTLISPSAPALTSWPMRSSPSAPAGGRLRRLHRGGLR